MQRQLERTPPLSPWWRVAADALEPARELVVLGLVLVACYLGAVFLVVL